MSGTDVMAEPQAVPETMARAVKLMRVGAGMEIVAGIAASLSNVHRLSVVASGVVTGMIVAGIWLLVARACRRARPVGRVLASVLFGFNTLGLLQTLVGEFHPAAVVVVFNVLSWIVGLGTVSLLWQHASNEFFRTRR